MPLSPEWQLLLAGATTQPTSADMQHIHQALGHPQLSWELVTQQACAHGIAPLLYHIMQHMGLIGVLPPAALEVLQRVSYATAVNHTLFSQALQRVLRALQDRGIAVIILKGAALAETVYPCPGVRPRRDVDLLVRAEALPQVEDTLGAGGWVPPFDVPLEVHWHLERPSQPFAIDLEGLWQRAIPSTIAGVETRILAPEDSLIRLCLHACHHAGAPMQEGRLNFRLLGCCGIAEVIRH